MEEILRDGLKSFGLDEAGVPAMLCYARFLKAKNKVMNLTALTEDKDIATLHFLDSAALAAYPERLDFHDKSVVDIGAGAGFPGLPLRLLVPSIHLTLLDAQKKRVTFLHEVCDMLKLSDVECIHARAEEYERREFFDIAVSRAVAAMPILAELCLPLVRVGGYMLAMKSVNSEAEVAEAAGAVHLLGGEYEESIHYVIPETNIAHRLIVIRKIQQTPKEYPRKFSKIKKKPLIIN